MRKEIIGDCTLFLEDCYTAISNIEKINAIITDPPYELSDLAPGSSHYGMSLRKFESDNYKNIVSGFDLSLFEHLEKICAPFNMFCFCSNKQISKIMSYHEERGRSTTLLVWHKTNAVPFANGVWRGDIEYVVHVKDSGATFIGDAKEKKKVSQYPIVSDLSHPTVKPLGLIQKYIKICSNKDDIIFDPFMGSGTTGVACVRMGRKFIGCEINPEYFELACRRIEDAHKQTDMFIDTPNKPEQLNL